jgi:PAS domain S-box-containing protein
MRFPAKEGLITVQNDEGGSSQERQQAFLGTLTSPDIALAIGEAQIMIRDMDGIILYWSRGCERLYGWPPAVAVGARSHELFRTEFPEPLADIQATLERDGGWTGELSHIRKDGSRVVVASHWVLSRRADGSRVVIETNNDITEKYLAQEAHEYLAAIVRSTDDAIVAKNVNSIVTSWNEAAERIFGYSAKEMIGKSIIILFTPETIHEEAVILDQIKRGEPVLPYETVRRHKDGRDVPILVTVSPIRNNAGQIIGAAKIARDVTERRRSAERFRAIFNSVGEGIFITDVATGKYLDVNAAGAAMFGYRPDELVGHSGKGVPVEARREARAWLDTAALGARPQRLEWQCTAKDGRVFWAEVSLRLDSIADQNVVVTVFRDATERRAIEEQLRQSQKMESIGNLTGGMAHDFNNLLGIIIGNLDILRDVRRDDEEVADLSGEALDAALRGADLTRRLLAFARRQPLQNERIDVNRLVTDTVQLLRRVLGEHVEISLRFSRDVCAVVADPAQLQAALTNLANNARDAMPKGGRLIIATGHRQLDADYAALNAEVAPGDYAMIEVTDTGTGMPPEIMGQIFEPFFTTKERDKGSGLGLSMVFGFMKQSGGHVSVYSEVGVGTTFRLYLPCDHEPAFEEEVAAPPAASAGGGEAILVVEDNPGLRRIVVRQLKELGYRVREAENPAEALPIIERGPIDLLFTDIVMPGGMDGFELMRLATERRPTLKILLTSGFPETKLDEQVDTARVRLLVKPYRKSDLARLVRETLDR